MALAVAASASWADRSARGPRTLSALARVLGYLQDPYSQEPLRLMLWTMKTGAVVLPPIWVSYV